MAKWISQDQVAFFMIGAIFEDQGGGFLLSKGAFQDFDRFAFYDKS